MDYMSLKRMKSVQVYLLLAAVVGVSFIMGCVLPSGSANAAPPTVDSTVPASSILSVGLYGTIDATFSKAMDPATIIAANFTVEGPGPVTGTVDYDDSNNTAIFTPSVPLIGSSIHTVTITTGAKDAAGNALAVDKVWSFTTGSVVDTTQPTVISTIPVNGGTIAVNDSVTATFSEAMRPATIGAASFTVAGGSAVTGTVTYDASNKSAIFNPSGSLASSSSYTATMTTGAKDLAGNPLVLKVWTFTTAAAGAGPAQVPLGTAGNFAILAKTGISTVPPSVITGDIGVSPVAESYMTGFSQTNGTGYATSPQVTGFMYAANMAPPTPAKMTTAIADMQTAYTDAAGRPAGIGVTNLNLGAGTLNGNTLVPGTYTWGTGVSIAGNITLSGGASDVWIFQVSGTLNESNGKQVVLSGGALAKNIFWQVSGAVTLGTTAHFEGIILGKTGITLQTGATMNGRALAQTLVALQKATVTKP
jgi:hypothetical protein